MGTLRTPDVGSTVLFKKLDWIVNARTGVVDDGDEEINYYSRDC